MNGQEPLAETGEGPPGSFAQHLQEALLPACALPDKRSDAVWRFFTGDMLGVVDHTDGLTQRAQAQANLGILGEAVLVPATNACKQIPPDKHRVATQGNHADP